VRRVISTSSVRLARRWWSVGAVLAAGCAQAAMPPGGPPDESPPELVSVRPDSNARNVRSGAVSFQFDEVVSERPQGAQSLSGAFLISPRDGEPNVSWRRNRVDVRPRRGFRPNTTYTVQLLPGMTDLDGNADSAGRTIVFSTGPELAAGRIQGVVFDWLAERAAPRAYVEAIALPDSTRYVTSGDSSGRFILAHVPPGQFLLRATIDQNRNRQLDPRELFDSATVTLTDSLSREMLAFVHDTIGPTISQVAVRDSLTLRVTFDRPLDTTLVITPRLFALSTAGAEDPLRAAVPIDSAIGGRAFDRRVEDSIRTRAIEDSVRQRLRADSIRRADSARLGAQPRPAQPAVPLPARADSARPTPLRPSRRPPETEVVLKLGQALRAGAQYSLRSVDVRSLLGATRSFERTFTTPRARPRPDTTARDTGSVRQAASRTGPDRP
jgi:hypothetical protein